MSLGNYYHEDICFICDECDAELHTDTKNLKLALELLKDEEWISKAFKSKQSRSGWRYEHKCPKCQ